MDLNWPAIVGVATVITVLIRIGAWLWRRNKPSAAASEGSSLISGNAHVGGTVIVGDGNVIHNAPPPQPLGHVLAASTQQRNVGTAGITLNELSDLLKNANRFKRKDLLMFYAGKTFMIRGQITRTHLTNAAAFGRRFYPAWRRCSSLKYSPYSRSSRLASQAPRPPRCFAAFMR